MKYRPSRRTRRFGIGAAAIIVVAGMNGPALYRFSSEKYHTYKINQPEYKAENGHWDVVNVPEEYRINTIHAALLHTGKVLLVAGSGNNAKNFDAKSFRSVLWDPEKNTYKNIPTPKDLFCAGHTQLPDGKLLVAGGTQRYEKLRGDVEKAGGLMFVHNENPDKPKTFPAGTRFTGKETGRTFESKDPVLVPRAKKTKSARTGKVKVSPSTARVYVEALRKGKKYQTGTEDNFRIAGLKGKDKRNFYGIAQKLSFDKKDFQGIKEAYEFDPVAERYITVDPMNEARWYPTLTTLQDGRVLSVSGLDEIGQVVPGKNEIYNPKTKKWKYLKKKRFFPTYPALFLTDKGRIFYTGSNAGYGPDDKGRVPGVWDLKSNKFDVVPGISDPGLLETSMSVLLPPAQDQRYMVLGGGGVGEDSRATAKTRIVDLHANDPRFKDGPDLYAEARYPSSVVLPDDTVLTTNGSGDYRGRGDSNVLKAEIYDPRTNTSRSVADPLVGRNYHSGALLLPDGRVMTFGSDSLFSDKANTKPGEFQQQIDIYTPPYLYRDSRPKLTDTGPRTVRRGGTTTYATSRPSAVKKVRLIRPSSFTHVTNVEQRSIAVDFERKKDGITVRLPRESSLVPPGWYMLNAVDKEGTPSEAVWVKVPGGKAAKAKAKAKKGAGAGRD
ncbi:galactose oxidase-like domain-containing protein [Streptomyces sp. NEAU-Y11]|uniref:galactose oxidase-like domain-containing protein n=1 Tax=Streptomyces cucumeris TaxID=2962890 RepID=UPI0020C92516|nr:galactose oxidase early set domain-containing protein [Streptomyces sp. NEAU-Y11]MCP9212457.1 galactose oxidase early set domain-containing protein [Streptomyces sp. NEAU-Y11]